MAPQHLITTHPTEPGSPADSSRAASPGRPAGRTPAGSFPASRDIARATLIVLGIAALAVLAWQLAGVLLLIFAAVLIAIVLRSLGELVARPFALRTEVGVGIASLAISAILGAFIFLLGRQIAAQAGHLWSALPPLANSVGHQIGLEGLGDQLVSRIEAIVHEPTFIESVLGVTAGLAGIGASVILALVAGLYLAFAPASYLRGFLRLFPNPAAQRIAVAIEASGRALRRWLLGELVAMVFIGTGTFLALEALGVESALALGILAGLLEFVPYLGPWMAAVPAILVALGQPGPLVFWVIGLYVVIQQIEGNLVTPLVQQRVGRFPPVLILFSLVAFGTVLGLPGVLLAVPLMVVGLVFVTQLYVRDALHENADLPGEPRSEHRAGAADG